MLIRGSLKGEEAESMTIRCGVRKIAGLFARVRWTISMKLAIIFILTQLPVYFCGILVYNWGVDVVRTNVIDRDLISLNYYLQDLERTVERIKYLQTNTAASNEISTYSNRYQHMDMYERSVYLNRIQRSLLSIQNSSRFLENVIVYIPKQNIKIEASGRHGQMTEEETVTARAHNLSVPSGLLANESTLHLNISYPPIYSHYLDDPYYAVVAVFSYAEICRSLESLGYGDSFYMLDDNDRVIASAGSLFAISEGLLPQNTNADGYITLVDGGARYIVTYARSSYFGYRLVHIMSEEIIFEDMRDYRQKMWIFMVVASIIVAFFIYAVRRTIHSPIQKLLGAFVQVGGGERNYKLPMQNNDEFEFLYQQFNNMMTSIDKLIQESYEQKLMLANSELNQLQAQINPHFIYNSYYMLHRIIKGDDKEKAMSFSRQMGVYFKYVVGDVGTMAPLAREIEHARIYAEIQAARFEGRIEVRFDEFPAEFNQAEAPRLILQPVLENAFEHAFADTLENGLLAVTFETAGKSLRIFADDNGDGLTDDVISGLNHMIWTGDVGREDCVGLMNINRRLQIAFGDGGYLRLSRSHLGGLRVELRLDPAANGGDSHV